jgi:hypothetical protein
MWLIKL